jgi:hypothetical protein
VRRLQGNIKRDVRGNNLCDRGVQGFISVEDFDSTIAEISVLPPDTYEGKYLVGKVKFDVVTAVYVQVMFSWLQCNHADGCGVFLRHCRMQRTEKATPCHKTEIPYIVKRGSLTKLRQLYDTLKSEPLNGNRSGQRPTASLPHTS